MTIKTKEHYERINDEVTKAIGEVNYHIRMAAAWRKLYYATKDKKGLGWLNRIACRQNGKHYSMGMELSFKNLETCFTVMDELNEFLKETGS